MPVKVAINGFGRIGRGFLRSARERGADVEVVAVNDVADAATLAALLRHDSVYGRFPGSVEAGDGHRVDGSEIRALSEAEPASCRGASSAWTWWSSPPAASARGRAAAQHLDAGARKVIISAPAKGSEPADATVVLGVNFDEVYDPEAHDVITNASCTTNCLAPVAKVLHEAVGIRHGLMTTVHAYTSDQNLLDGPHSDLRRARAGAINLVPTSTGAAKALGLVIPELEGRLHGYAVRVPLPTGSLVDLTVETERETSAEEVNAAFRERADSGALGGILAYSEEPLVATDIVGSPYSSVFDAPLTSVIDGTQVKVVAWYDNEWGYATRMVELAERVHGAGALIRLTPEACC